MGLYIPNTSTPMFCTTTTPPIGASYPWSVGFWVNSGSDGVSVNASSLFYALSDSSLNGSFLQPDASGHWQWVMQDAASNSDSIVGGTMVLGGWTYILMRALSSTNRQFATLNPGGSVTSVAGSATAVATVTVANQTLSNASFGSTGTNSAVSASALNSTYSEFFCANGDPQNSTGTTDSALIYQLAFKGPFSVPAFVPKIAEYRSLRNPSIIGGTARDIYNPQAVQWALLDGGGTTLPTNGIDRQLPYSYRGPQRDTNRLGQV